MSQVTLYLPDALEAKIRREAEQSGKSMSGYVASVLERELGSKKWPEPFLRILREGGAEMEIPRSLPPDRVFLCSIVQAELLFGARNSLRYAENMDRLSVLFDAIPSLAFDDEAAAEYAKVRAVLTRERRPIGANDMLIAAIALSRDLAVVTRNTKEFERVPGLRVERQPKLVDLSLPPISGHPKKRDNETIPTGVRFLAAKVGRSATNRSVDAQRALALPESLEGSCVFTLEAPLAPSAPPPRSPAQHIHS